MASNQMKVQPHDLEAEQAIIAACLIRPQIVPIVRGILASTDFYREAHGMIIKSIYALGTTSDLITLKDDLKSRGILEKVGGLKYLSDLIDSFTLSAGWRTHADIVIEMSKRRKVINASVVAMEKAFQLSEEIPDVISNLKSDISSIEKDQNPEIESNLSIVQEVVKQIERSMDAGGEDIGLKVGLRNIDDNLQGMEPQTTTYLIARPSIGKTALALTISDYVAKTSGPVLFFSLESNRYALTRRRLSANSHVYLSKIRRGNIAPSEWGSVIDACNSLSSLPLIIADNARYKDPLALVSLAETVNMQTPLSMMVIDHIQLMRPRRSMGSRHQEISLCSDALGTLAKVCKCPLLILCQLSRPTDRVKNVNPYPSLEMMKESGDLEQNADNVWGLWREDKESPFARLEQLKGRDTGTWHTWFKFDRWIQNFTDLQHGEWPDDNRDKKTSKDHWTK